MLTNKKYEFEGVQVCVYPFEVMGLSQLMNSTPSHMGRLAIDEAGRGLGRDRAIAPYDLKILWKKPYGNKTGILFTNTRPVLCADDMIHPPLTANGLFWHDNNTSDLHVGQLITQGTPFYDEGNADNASGDHVHIMTSFGKWDGRYPMTVVPMYGTYTLKNAIAPYNFFFINDTVRRRDGGYPWKECVGIPLCVPLKDLVHK